MKAFTFLFLQKGEDVRDYLITAKILQDLMTEALVQNHPIFLSVFIKPFGDPLDPFSVVTNRVLAPRKQKRGGLGWQMTVKARGI